MWDIIPLERQFMIAEEYTVILAKTKNSQLVVLEITETEDPDIINQLTHYYHYLKIEQPFQDQINYNLPIRLIAIAPNFHKHNFIDRLYNILQFELIRFAIINDSENINNFHLHLYLENNHQITINKTIPLVNQELEEKAEIAKLSNLQLFKLKGQVNSPRKVLVNFLDKLSPVTKIEILKLREQMLTSNQRVKEIKDGRSIFYGLSKTKPCCQFKLFSSTTSRNLDHLQCYLWLPIPKRFIRFNKASNKISGTGRMYLGFDADFQTIQTITYWTIMNRYANETPISMNIYLDEIGLDQEYQKVEKLFDLAVKLNLENN
ncbi:hypothetical protein H6F32_17435 [Anabaena sp. FACHB-1237]|uniref:hypothetical protein n=1 Tax=Anabaena sp. FACHB-1237 TaxID=2692769 RepID=UPI0016800EA7|nr:hypothetical protein [Anabaena sp. FACHB-1237]MBD2139309.1 hypothetical protein [Anabaena sp. FACHB-1237]